MVRSVALCSSGFCYFLQLSHFIFEFLNFYFKFVGFLSSTFFSVTYFPLAKAWFLQCSTEPFLLNVKCPGFHFIWSMHGSVSEWVDKQLNNICSVAKQLSNITCNTISFHTAHFWHPKHCKSFRAGFYITLGKIHANSTSKLKVWNVLLTGVKNEV